MWPYVLWHCVGTTVLKGILPPRSSVKCKWGREAKGDPLHTIKIYRGNKGTARVILNLGTRCSQVVNFMLWLLYLWERTPAPIKRQGGPQSQSEHIRQEKISWPCWDSNPRSSSPQLSQCIGKGRMFFQHSGDHLSDYSVSLVKTSKHIWNSPML
jgi:hypothetical protein